MLDQIKSRIQPGIERLAQIWVACFAVMVHAAPMEAKVAHAIVALKTSVLATVALIIASFIPKISAQGWQIWLVGIATAVADWLVHPGALGGAGWTEGVATGLLAMVLMVGWEQFMHWKSNK